MFSIGFDAKRAFLNSTGLGNYSRSVILSLAQLYPNIQFNLYTPRAPKNSMNAELWTNPSIEIHIPKLPFLRSLWRSRLVVRQLVMDKVQLYHGLSHEIPIGIQRTGIKTVVTIHDLIFLRYPHYYKAIDRKIYALKFKYACTHSDMIIATSEQTKEDIIRYFGINAAKIKVVYQACNPLFYQSYDNLDKERVIEKYRLPKRYLLNVGTIEARKNLLVLIKALPHVPQDYKLVVVGKSTAYKNDVLQLIQQLKLQERVLFLQDVQNDELPYLYSAASVFVYPSVFEGFGIPIMEALHVGVPVIAATGSCLEEAGGEGSLYFNPQDATTLAAQINEVLENTILSEKMIAEGKQYAANFTEEAHARNLMKVYEQLLLQ